ncbi:hypothetical protein [Thioalkalivibrio sp.]|uniref:hypothetical protein n=1 Tax=Thioalkalivibrio sp. TaxID=2093813 RepID=UPI003976BCFD
MIKNLTLKTLTFAAALAVAGSLQASELNTPANLGYEVGMSGEVSYSGRFPTQAMEDQYNAYLAWVDSNGLDVTHAVAPEVRPVASLDGVLNGNVSATGRFPTQAMEDQFNAYLSWVEQAGLDQDYAFRLNGVN